MTQWTWAPCVTMTDCGFSFKAETVSPPPPFPAVSFVVGQTQVQQRTRVKCWICSPAIKLGESGCVGDGGLEGWGADAFWEGIEFLVTLRVNPRSALWPTAGLDQDQRVLVGKQHTHTHTSWEGNCGPLHSKAQHEKLRCKTRRQTKSPFTEPYNHQGFFFPVACIHKMLRKWTWLDTKINFNETSPCSAFWMLA